MAHVIATAAAPKGFIAAVERLRAAVGLFVRRRVEYARTLDELQSLTDRELADLGMSRCDLRRIAAEAAARV